MTGRKRDGASLAAKLGRQVERPDHEPEQVQVSTIRRTVDLAPKTHHALNRYQDEQAVALGLSSVYSQDVLEGLAEELLVNEELQKIIAGRIKRKRGGR